MDAIVAVYSDWGIGADGTQPVILKADRQHFVELTRGRTVIVGRRTLADFPGGRPLKGRRNIVLTRGDTVIDGAGAGVYSTSFSTVSVRMPFHLMTVTALTVVSLVTRKGPVYFVLFLGVGSSPLRV